VAHRVGQQAAGVSEKIQKIRDAANGQTCIVPGCGCTVGVVTAHYSGVRRGSFGGGLGMKVHDLVSAHLCQQHHTEQDTLNRDKDKRWENSEVFEFYCLLTIIRLYEQGVLKIV
jgi:hypothetical protein